MEADLTFRSLIVVVDDFGRFDARPAKLKAALFPMRDSVTQADVMKWVCELAEGDDPPIILYEIEGRPYLQLTGWEKHRGKGRRAESSKYPEMLNPSIPRKSEETQCNPPVGRGTRDEGRGTRSGIDPAGSPRISRGRHLCPDPMPPDDLRRIAAKLGEMGTPASTADRKAVFVAEALADWSRSKGEKRVDWVRAAYTGIRKGWLLDGWSASVQAKAALSKPPDPVPQQPPLVGNRGSPI